MSKTFHRVNKDDSEREYESPAHKNRRNTRKMLTATHYLDEDHDPFSEEILEEINVVFERYEPIKRRKAK